MVLRLAQVAVPLPLDRIFCYSVPPEISSLDIGHLIVVPFGKRKITGYVVGLPEKSAVPVKNIVSLAFPTPVFSRETLKFYEYVRDFYLASLGEVIKMALPPGIDKKSALFVSRDSNKNFLELERDESEFVKFLDGKKLVAAKEAKKFNLGMNDLKSLEKRGFLNFFSEVTPKLKAAYERYAELDKEKAKSYATRSKKEKELMTLLSVAGRLSFTEMRRHAKAASSILSRLEGKGVVRIFQVEEERTPYLEKSVPKDTPPKLYEDQERAVSAIDRKVSGGTFGAFLLHGITGSGKTEVYMRVIENVLQKGKNALALVPEIALTPQFIRRFRARFGDSLAVLHSSMSKGERYDQWRKVLRGESRIVIGARSAIFAPLENIGVIVVDEEHDQSYKQEDRVMYNARDLAVERARLAGAVVILGSATPSFESYYKALSGQYELLSLSSRTSDFGLPDVEIVDLRQEKGKLGKKGFLSEKLIEAIRENYDAQGKTILFLNRRGFSSFVICRNCGVSIKCPNCSVSLKYHDKEASLVCHYCNYSTPMYGFCSTCGSKSLWRVGFGTEQVENEIKAHFPELRVERMDRDTTTKKFSHERIIKRLEAGEIDVLIGTQMVSKGLDAKKVTLVGVVLADVSLNLPDFRSCEKTFSLLTQVAGRSGRGQSKGKVIIQTYNPEHYSISEAKNQDYSSFYEKEIGMRKDVSYPPFVKLVNVRFSSPDQGKLNSAMKKIKSMADKSILADDDFKGSVEILGPSPAPIERVKGEFRWHMLIKGKDEKSLVKYVRAIKENLKSLKRSDLSYRIDIDPQNFM